MVKWAILYNQLLRQQKLLRCVFIIHSYNCLIIIINQGCLIHVAVLFLFHFTIMRHRLNKKNPSAAKSEAVKPIIYYLDNGTPEPIRSALLDGGKWWNQAFEAAGYTNAFDVRILPDSADPMDIRYNMINWVHRST